MNYDVATLVRNTLSMLGCDQQRVSDFDNHSTITLSFFRTPDINILEIDGNIWLHSIFDFRDFDEITSRSDEIIKIMMTPYEWSLSRSIGLTAANEQIEQLAVINPEYLNGRNNLCEALQDFYQHLKEIIQPS